MNNRLMVMDKRLNLSSINECLIYRIKEMITTHECK